MLLPPASEGWGGGGTVFSFSVRTLTGRGTPSPSRVSMKGSLISGPGWGKVPPSQVQDRRIPHLRSGQGVPNPADEGYLIPGHFPLVGWGTPLLAGLGTFHADPRSGWGYSIACTCYAACGMPLAFTQEDFLVAMFSEFAVLVIYLKEVEGCGIIFVRTIFVQICTTGYNL